MAQGWRSSRIDRQVQRDGTVQVSFALGRLADHLIQTKLTLQVPAVGLTIKLVALANDTSRVFSSTDKPEL